MSLSSGYKKFLLSYFNAVLAFSLLLMLTGCVSFKSPRKGKNYEVGRASWYGRDFHGRPTASGERYNMYKLTAAHKFAPLGTYAKVENLENHRKVTVKINDRGPFIRGRIIDLSYAAAKKINMVGAGTARVKVTFLGSYDPRASVGNAEFFLQVGSFREKSNADNLRDELSRNFAQVFSHKAVIGGKAFYRVCIGPLKDDEKILGYKRELENFGHYPFVTSELCKDN